LSRVAVGKQPGPLVSIVTPTRNRAALLEWTMRSVRNQTYPNVEHLIMDGASTDGTPELLRRYDGTYRMTWISEPDGGMYQAINKGLGLANGEIMAYLNSDDLYLPWTIDLVVDAFRDHPEADFVFGDALTVDDATGQHSLYWMPPFDLQAIRRSGFLAQPAVFWRREAFLAEGPFDESLRYVADCDFWMRAGARRRFFKVNEFLAVERNHGSTLRESVGEPLWAELAAVRSRYVSLSADEGARMARRDQRRALWWGRLYAATMLLQSFVPAPLRRGPWSRALNARLIHVNRLRFLVRALPLVKRVRVIHAFAATDIIRPGRTLLEPK
jgi:glycosyltransferase involved in cell wall biosynthesis